MSVLYVFLYIYLFFTTWNVFFIYLIWCYILNVVLTSNYTLIMNEITNHKIWSSLSFHGLRALLSQPFIIEFWIAIKLRIYFVSIRTSLTFNYCNTQDEWAPNVGPTQCFRGCRFAIALLFLTKNDCVQCWKGDSIDFESVDSLELCFKKTSYSWLTVLGNQWVFK